MRIESGRNSMHLHRRMLQQFAAAECGFHGFLSFVQSHRSSDDIFQFHPFLSACAIDVTRALAIDRSWAWCSSLCDLNSVESNLMKSGLQVTALNFSTLYCAPIDTPIDS